MSNSLSNNQNKNSKSIVLFGGTFNPIHQGHITPVIEAANNVGAEKLIYLPCNIPPHKAAPSVTSKHRFDMVKIALGFFNEVKSNSINIEVSDYEISQSRTSYTRYTIEHFAKQYPNHTLYFLIGMDSLLQFTQWYKWNEVLDFCRLLVIQRPNYQQDINELPRAILDKTAFVKTQQIDVSSTELRNELSTIADNQARSSTDHIPPPVQQYIKRYKLYNSR